MSKNTVKSYLQKLASSQLSLDALLELEAPALESVFHTGSPAYKNDNERYHQFVSRLDYFLSELKRPGVTRHLLWEDYLHSHPKGYRYTQFCFHLDQHTKASKPSMVLMHKAGEKLFIDFAGKGLSYTDINTGQVVDCQIFVACLPYSDYGFALAVRSQSIEDFLYALGCCLQSLGGVPQMIVSDNLKSAVIKANRYEPQINRAMEDFANHYGCSVVPTRAVHPQDKALVENHVKLVYQRVHARLRNTTFTSLSALNQGISDKILAHNQTRMQQKPYCRQERFLSDEQSQLGPLPAHPFEIKYYREYKVAKNNHIYLAEDKHYYSVPFRWTGSQVKVVYTHTLVRIYAAGQQVAVHERDRSMASYSTLREHLCSAHNHYNDRSPAYYIGKARRESELFGSLLELVFKQDRHPEQLYRSCDGMLALYRKCELSCFEKACRMAIEYQNYSYDFLRNVIEHKMTGEQGTGGTKKEKPLPAHQNIRGREYYTQSTLNLD